VTVVVDDVVERIVVVLVVEPGMVVLVVDDGVVVELVVRAVVVVLVPPMIVVVVDGEIVTGIVVPTVGGELGGAAGAITPNVRGLAPPHGSIGVPAVQFRLVLVSGPEYIRDATQPLDSWVTSTPVNVPLSGDPSKTPWRLPENALAPTPTR